MLKTEVRQVEPRAESQVELQEAPNHKDYAINSAAWTGNAILVIPLRLYMLTTQALTSVYFTGISCG